MTEHIVCLCSLHGLQYTRIQGDQLCRKKMTRSIFLRLSTTFLQMVTKSILQLDICFLALVLSFCVIFTLIESHLCRV